ncbi:MAG: 16S rRNA (uracil(1498)-N(3))-methyltransferase [Gammaproteobacteria bacterium]|nr:16S rRNA (uracil(1498)-N(3))-methyltransferase [Gammaproteobacteria bacterium]
MRIPRIYLPIALKIGDFVTLDGQASVHVARVLRLKKNDTVIIFNGQGGEYLSVIAEIDKRAVSVIINHFNDRWVESPLLVTLVQAVSRGDRMDFTLQKAVELGVHEIIPVLTQHTVFNVKGDRASKKHQHWQGIVRSACEQSGRTYIPKVHVMVDLVAWLDQQRTTVTTTKIMLDPRAGQQLNQLTAPQNHRIVLLIGPEGGFSGHEINIVQRERFVGVSLGPRILRTETAALSVLSALQLMWGDF